MYKVDWLDSAISELAAVWTAATSVGREAIRRAVSNLEDRLHHDPYSEGESREGDERVVFCDPLALAVEVDGQEHTVTVLHVWRIRRR